MNDGMPVTEDSCRDDGTPAPWGAGSRKGQQPCKSRIICLGILFLLSFGFSSCLSGCSDQSGQDVLTQSPAPSSTITGYGMVVCRLEEPVRFPFDVEILEWMVRPGQTLVAGDAVFLSDRMRIAARRDAFSEEREKLGWERQAAEAEKLSLPLISGMESKTWKEHVEAVERDLKAIRVQIASLLIHAPFSGHFSLPGIREGMAVTKGQMLGILYDDDLLNLRVTLTIRRENPVVPGMKATISISQQDSVCEGTVVSVKEIGNEESNSLVDGIITLSIPNPGCLAQDMVATATMTAAGGKGAGAGKKAAAAGDMEVAGNEMETASSTKETDDPGLIMTGTGLLEWGRTYAVTAPLEGRIEELPMGAFGLAGKGNMVLRLSNDALIEQQAVLAASYEDACEDMLQDEKKRSCSDRSSLARLEASLNEINSKITRLDDTISGMDLLLREQETGLFRMDADGTVRMLQDGWMAGDLLVRGKETVKADMPLLRLLKLDSREVVCHIEEQLAKDIRRGNRVQMSLYADPAVVETTAVDFVSGRAEAVNGETLVGLFVSCSDERFLPGHNVTLRIQPGTIP